VWVVLADAGYGEVTEFRQGLEARHLPYAVGIPSTVRVWTKPPAAESAGRRRRPTIYHYGEQRPCAVREVAEKLVGGNKCAGEKARKAGWSPASTLVASSPRTDSTKASRPTRSLAAGGMAARREGADEILSLRPAEHYTLRRLVRIVKGRWKIEQDYQQLKEELGLDHYEGRNWTGWHHHVTLVMLAHAFLTLEMLRSKKNFWVDPATDAS